MYFSFKGRQIIPEKKYAIFRFYEELNDFLPAKARKKEQIYYFWSNPSVKDAIEAQGIPHTEVEIIIAGGESVGFDYRLKKEDRIAVYPVFESVDISPLLRLRPSPLRNIRFIVDQNLSKLARWLRLLGFDTRCEADLSKLQIVNDSLQEERVILTTNKSILKMKNVTRGYYVREQIIDRQIPEIFKRFDLRNRIKPFTRCMVCNGKLGPIDKASVTGKIPKRITEQFEIFMQCEKCGKIYWEGSHYRKIQLKLEQIYDIF
jgi:uncharacterized protein with PIN domain